MLIHAYDEDVVRLGGLYTYLYAVPKIVHPILYRQGGGTRAVAGAGAAVPRQSAQRPRPTLPRHGRRTPRSCPAVRAPQLACVAGSELARTPGPHHQRLTSSRHRRGAPQPASAPPARALRGRFASRGQSSSHGAVASADPRDCGAAAPQRVSAIGGREHACRGRGPSIRRACVPHRAPAPKPVHDAQLLLLKPKYH